MSLITRCKGSWPIVLRWTERRQRIKVGFKEKEQRVVRLEAMGSLVWVVSEMQELMQESSLSSIFDYSHVFEN